MRKSVTRRFAFLAVLSFLPGTLLSQGAPIADGTRGALARSSSLPHLAVRRNPALEPEAVQKSYWPGAALFLGGVYLFQAGTRQNEERSAEIDEAQAAGTTALVADWPGTDKQVYGAMLAGVGAVVLWRAWNHNNKVGARLTPCTPSGLRSICLELPYPGRTRGRATQR